MDALPDDLGTLVETALALEGADRRRSAARVNGWLRIRRQVASEPERDQVLQWLDEPRFAQLKDDRGVPCRAEAVELLLSLGYPGALHVSPEALEAAHREPLEPNRLERLGSLGAATGFLPILGMWLFGAHSWGCFPDQFYEVAPFAFVPGLFRAAFGAGGSSRGFGRWLLHLLALAALGFTGLALVAAWYQRAPFGFVFALIAAVSLAVTFVPRKTRRA